MTAHDPRVTLAEAEQDALIRAVTNPDDSCVHNVAPLMRAVEQIIAARLAPIRALADKFDGHAIGRDFFGFPLDSWVPVVRLRAALEATGADLSASQDHDGAEGQGEGERAGEGCSCVPDGWHVVNPVYMSKLKRLEAEHG